MTPPTIFVAIASYRDPLLQQTVLGAVANATHPERIRFGVVDQCDLALRWPIPTDPALRQMLQYLWVDPLVTRGTCFARALTQTLYRGETIYCQVDAHMAFPKGWDEWVEHTLMERMAVTPDCVVSAYPASATPNEQGQLVIHPYAARSVTTHRVKETAQFTDRGAYLDMEIWVHHDRVAPIRGYHIAAGLLLAPGRFVEQFPYDPHLYYLGEEQMLALRVYTHGWTIWHPASPPIGHRYNDKQDPAIRPVHWADDPQQQRPISHEVWSHQSYQRQRRLVSIPHYGGAYGLGTRRTLDQFADDFGIDYRQRTIDFGKARGLPREEWQ